MSDSVQPHRWQPTRLPRPWDSPGTNTGVGCHFLLQCMKVKSESEVAQSCPTLSDPMDCSPPAPRSMGFSPLPSLNMWLGPCNSGRCSSKWIIKSNYMPPKYMHIFSFYLSSFSLSSLLPRLQIHILFFGAMTGMIPNLQIYLEKTMISTLSFCSATKTALYLSIPLYHQ